MLRTRMATPRGFESGRILSSIHLADFRHEKPASKSYGKSQQKNSKAMYAQFRMSKFPFFPFFPYETKSYMNEPAI